MAGRVITANRLREGDVVFLAPDGTWTCRVSDAAVAQSEADEQALMERAQIDVARCEVVEPYAVEVDPSSHNRPVRTRERLRTLGPSVRLDLGHQAMGAATGQGDSRVLL